MDILICGNKTMRLEDGTLATLVDKSGQIIAVLAVSGDCWSEVAAAGVRMNFDPCAEAHIEYETTATEVPATDAATQLRKSQALRICRDKLGNIVKCPPR